MSESEIEKSQEMTSQINVEVMLGTCMRELPWLESWSG